MTADPLETQRKRLIFRSWHRGTREMDLLLGSFADAHVPSFDADELRLYEDILQYSDPDLYNWVSGREDIPANCASPVMTKLCAHRFAGS